MQNGLCESRRWNCWQPRASSQPSVFSSRSQDTLRDCDQESTCYNTVISPIYFVSFVLTAQFVLVNVVIAVLMKHLEESNKEAKEEAELEAELEMEMKTISPGQHSPSDIFTWMGGVGGERPESPRGCPHPLQIQVDSQLSLVYPMVRSLAAGCRGAALRFCWGKTCTRGGGGATQRLCGPHCSVGHSRWQRRAGLQPTAVQSFAVCSGDGPELPRAGLNSTLALMQRLGSALCESKITSIISLLF